MSTTTIVLYKNARLDNSKNFVIDSIETYLAGLTSATFTSMQYQRFEINKTIKLDLSQNYQTKSTTLNKYNYCKISTTVNNAAVNYYYFILRTTQKSESTIELELRMDTLNTFNFSSSVANDSYTLSNKTVVNREHKDRIAHRPVQFIPRDITASEAQCIRELDNYVSFSNTNDENVVIAVIKGGILSYMTRYSVASLDLRVDPQNGTYIQVGDEKFDEFDELSFTKRLSILYMTIYYNGHIVKDFISLPSNIAFVIPSNGYMGQQLYDPNNIFDWTQFVYEAYNYTKSYDIIDNKYKRIINPYQEGFSTILFKKRESNLLDGDENNQWYLLYSSQNAVASANVDYAVKAVNPVDIRFYSDKGYTISHALSVEVSLSATSPLIPKWQYQTETMTCSVEPAPASVGQKYVKIAGTTYDFYDYSWLRFERENNNSLVFSYATLRKRDDTYVTIENVDSITFYGINSISCEGVLGGTTIYINSGAGSYSGTAPKWEDLDLTDSKYLKAFAFPYCPCEFMIGKTSFSQVPETFVFNADNFIQLSNPQKYKFEYQKKFSVPSPLFNINILYLDIGYGKPKNIIYESKLYHSDYFQPKFVYDSFSFSFNLEYVDIDEVNANFTSLDTSFYCTYIVSRNVQSKFAFIFDEYFTTISTQDYENVLTIERNNEKALYNNAYIDYIRSGGYSYDTKKAGSQTAMNGLTTALSIIGAVGSFASSAYTGGVGIAAGIAMTTTAIGGIARTIHSAQEQDTAIAQKMNQAVMQGTTVQGSEDIDILTAISGNKAKLVYYEVSDTMKQAMWDLFHECGYATKEQKIPDVTTRLYFNFVQADIVFGDYSFNEDIADDIRNKWKEGITFFHLVNGSYDLDQEYENFETSLL